MPVPDGPPPPRRLRILCLHSFRTSGKIFEEQLQRAQLTEALGDLVELTHVDAPHPASGAIPRDVKPYFDGPYFEWFTAEAVGDRVEFDEAKLEASELFLTQLLERQGPFDGLMGFSQGAVMSSALVALQRSGLRPRLSALPPLRFCVLFAGMKSRHPQHAAAFAALGGKVPCPSLHVYGDRDALKNPHCVELADSFRNSTVLLHQRGHSIPALKGPQLAVLRAFLVSAAGDAEELRVDAAAARAAAAAAAEAGGLVARGAPGPLAARAPRAAQAQAQARERERDMGPAEGGEEDDDGGQGGGKAPIRREACSSKKGGQGQGQGQGRESAAGAGAGAVAVAGRGGGASFDLAGAGRGSGLVARSRL
ncbi:hypothetical protein HYH02_008160 [Chlamydomonas schloesseri]|uniref:Serine hydrolase domain-containing protein n=1 Tax=Chlamydomonas schloesseri TaxID=2026947 RepID=A0A836B3Y4_9CHLO|nr:hypothetical protein HYH02_008160 [Chlamydomonas schloesseri]|eukprot:KAG2447006.1 hypothetical protein HYH02_008160 [Chlamydomonas schloesseri]